MGVFSGDGLWCCACGIEVRDIAVSGGTMVSALVGWCGGGRGRVYVLSDVGW